MKILLTSLLFNVVSGIESAYHIYGWIKKSETGVYREDKVPINSRSLSIPISSLVSRNDVSIKVSFLSCAPPGNEI